MPHDLETRNCAIYTRKSSEEGLEQNFNSLDAQREACEAYIESQRQEGWRLVRKAYDDGGISGGTMERPGLQSLLDDIRDGKVDVVVVYKVDRLTRSLADFARMVELFEENGVSFVSITQQFNTTSSMGRLILNVLLSFAQFEREVTGERIRDKIAASKKKGMWMGGTVPLGYDVVDKELVVNREEAVAVRHIFKRYLDLGCVRRLQAELKEQGYKSKVRKSAKGNVSGGKFFTRGALYTVLRNRLYVGEVVHQDTIYQGEHEAILEQELWNKVQEKLAANRTDRKQGRGVREASLLAGLLFDAKGKRLTPSHATKDGKRYRYYVSQALVDGKAKGAARGVRIPATELENIVVSQIEALLTAPDRLLEALAFNDDLAAQQHLLDRAAEVMSHWREAQSTFRKQALQTFVHRIEVHTKKIRILCDRDRLRLWLCDSGVVTEKGLRSRVGPPGDLITLTADFHIKKRGVEAKLIVDCGGGSRHHNVDLTLVKAVARAHAWNRKLVRGETRSIRALARELGVTNRYVRKILPLAFLAPDIVKAVLEGRQPADLSLEALTRISIPCRWEDQRRALGFAGA